MECAVVGATVTWSRLLRLSWDGRGGQSPVAMGSLPGRRAGLEYVGEILTDTKEREEAVLTARHVSDRVHADLRADGHLLTLKEVAPLRRAGHQLP